MENKKIFSKIFTIILLILIIASLTIAIYKGYEYFKNKKTDNEAKSIVDEFDESIKTITLAEYEEQKKNNKQNKNDKKDNEADQESEESGSRSSRRWRPKKSRYKYYVIGTIRIPRTGIKYPIYSIAGEKALENGIGMLKTDNGLNEVGDTLLQGHNWNNWMFFSRNHLIKKGDVVYIKDDRGINIKYRVYKKFKTSPTDASYITRDTKGKREITLSTCTNYAKDRLIILAREV